MTTTQPNELETTSGADAVDFIVVARVLADAALLVRTRGELGDRPTRDRRPRIRAGINRAAALASVPFGAAGGPVRAWAIRLAAMEINAALGRGRHRDGGDVGASASTLDGFGLDVGTLGAVNTAADLVAAAANTAELIAAATAVPVYGHGPVIAYHLEAVRATEVELDDIVAVASGFGPVVDGLVGDQPRNLRVQDIGLAGGRRVFVVHTPAGAVRVLAEEVSAGLDSCANTWRPVPQLPHPWQRH